MKNLTPEQQVEILSWMENRIHRGFREEFATTFPGVSEEETINAETNEYKAEIISLTNECKRLKSLFNKAEIPDQPDNNEHDENVIADLSPEELLLNDLDEKVAEDTNDEKPSTSKRKK